MGWLQFIFLGAFLPLTFGIPTESQYRANAVKEAFQFSWNGYKTYAFPHDELHPVSNTYSDSRQGLCET